MNRFNKTNIRIGLVQGFYWMASCVFVSFLVRLLSGYGYNDYESGIALSVSAFAALTVQPLIGKLADKAKSVSRLLAVCFLISILGAFCLSIANENRVVAYIIIFVVFGSFRSLIYVIDLWSFAAGSGDESFSYGFTRSFGAVFYALSAPFYGDAIDRFGISIIVPCFMVMSLIAMVMVLIAPKPDTEKKEKNTISFRKALKKLISNKHYMILLISYMLIEMSAIPGQNYLTRKFEVLGARDIYTGIALLLMGLLQLPSLNSIDKLGKRFKAEILIEVSLFGLLLRTVILAFATTAIGTVCAFLTEPFAFGLYIGAILLYMHEYLDEDVMYFGTTLYSAATGGLGGIVGNYIAGLLASRYGIIPMLELMIIPALIGFCLYTLSILIERRR